MTDIAVAPPVLDHATLLRLHEDPRSLSRFQILAVCAGAPHATYRASDATLWQLVVDNDWADSEMERAFRAADRRVDAELEASKVADAERLARREAAVAIVVDVDDTRAHLEMLAGADARDPLIACMPRSWRAGMALRRMSIDDVRESLPELAVHNHLFVTVHDYSSTSRSGSPSRLRAFFVDIDYEKDLARAELIGGEQGARHYKRTVARALYRVFRRMPPDLIIHSGRGLHLYFLVGVDDVLNVGDKPDVVRWRAHQEGLVASLGTCEINGHKISIADHGAKDVARVLRLAGSANHKDENHIRPVIVAYKPTSVPRRTDVAAELALRLRFKPGKPQAARHAAANVHADVHADVQLARIVERLEGCERSGDAHLAFCPNHDDRPTPNFLTFSKADGAKVFFCRRGNCVPVDPPDAPPSARWCSRMGIPFEVIRSAASIRKESSWYATIAHVDEALADAAFMRVVEQIDGRRTHNEVALWDAWCPFSQLDFDDETKRAYAVVDDAAVPGVRLFLDQGRGIQLRCECAPCRLAGVGMMRRLCEKFGIGRDAGARGVDPSRRRCEPGHADDDPFEPEEWLRSIRAGA